MNSQGVTGNPADDDRLSGWKDIATYLHFSVRKAQRRQEKGLPVYRIGGGVYAYKSALESWLKHYPPESAADADDEPESTTGDEVAARPETARKSTHRSLWIAAVCVASLGVAAVAIVAVRKSTNAQPEELPPRSLPLGGLRTVTGGA